MCPSDQMNSILLEDHNHGKALVAVLNSVIFLAQLVFAKEESTGRFMHVRISDLETFDILPEDPELVRRLCRAYDRYSRVGFPALREQLDRRFQDRYNAYRVRDRQTPLIPIGDVEPHPERLEFDADVLRALGVTVTVGELKSVYEAIVREMIVVRTLTRD